MHAIFQVPAGAGPIPTPAARYAFGVPAGLYILTVTEALHMTCPAPSALACCIGEVAKKTGEIVPVILDWMPRIESIGGGQLVGVTAEILDSQGAALGVNANNLAVALTGETPRVAFDRRSGISKVWVTLGVDDTDYRVVIEATIRDCDGNDSLFQTCVLVAVKDC